MPVTHLVHTHAITQIMWQSSVLSFAPDITGWVLCPGLAASLSNLSNASVPPELCLNENKQKSLFVPEKDVKCT